MNLARVTAYHPETGKADLLFLSNGRRVPGVRVMSAHASSSSGRVGQAVPDSQDASDPYAVPAAGDRKLIACVAYYDGVPVVQGFLHDADSELLFPDADRMMDRTPSDFYHTVDGAANAEWFHPSGAYVRIGTDPAHEDLTGQDFQGKFTVRRNTDKQVHIHIEQAGGLATVDIAPSGAIKVTSKSTVDFTAEESITVTTKANMTVKADGYVAVTAGGAVDVKASGDISMSSDSSITMNAPRINLNG
jgi:hypothetical protein